MQRKIYIRFCPYNLDMNAIELLTETKKYPTFDLSTFASIIKKEHAYARLYLHRLKQKKIIHQLQRNVYTTHTDPLLIASRIIWPSYLSLWSAFRYHHFTEQNPQAIFIITSRKKRKKTIHFMNTELLFDYLPPRYFYGYTKDYLSGFEIFVAEPEKAFFDAVLLKKISLSELFFILQENQHAMNREKLINFLQIAQNSCINKRIGWMLDRIGFDHHTDLSYTTAYIPLDYTKPLTGPKNKTWRVIENMETPS